MNLGRPIQWLTVHVTVPGLRPWVDLGFPSSAWFPLIMLYKGNVLEYGVKFHSNRFTYCSNGWD